jgi:hypothetical protein
MSFCLFLFCISVSSLLIPFLSYFSLFISFLRLFIYCWVISCLFSPFYMFIYPFLVYSSPVYPSPSLTILSVCPAHACLSAHPMSSCFVQFISVCPAQDCMSIQLISDVLSSSCLSVLHKPVRLSSSFLKFCAAYVCLSVQLMSVWLSSSCLSVCLPRWLSV